MELTVGYDEHSEEGAAARGVTVPIRPSQKEANKQMITHIPFRAWRPHCVQGNTVEKRQSEQEVHDRVNDLGGNHSQLLHH